MSFWFTKQKGPRQALAKPAGAVLMAPGTRTTKQNAATLGRLGCGACPHNAIGEKLEPTLVKGADVYIVAESPEWDEKLVRECIPKGQKASFDSVVNCSSDHTPTWQEAECCRPRRIKWIEEAKPKLILGLGVVPLKFFLNSTDIDGMRGRLFAIQVGSHSCWFMPTFDPDFIRKKAYDKKKPLNSRLGYCFRMDISRALDIGYALQSPSIPSHDTIRGSILVYNGDGALFLELIDLLKEAIKAPVKAVDIETKGLRPFSDGAAIMTVAISYDDVNFSFAVDHPKAGWTGEQKQQILVLLEELLKDDTVKVAHNAPFELEWFISYFGLGVVNHAAWECTQMQAQFLDERRGKAHGSDDSHRAAYQSLDFLVKQHFGISYKSDFKLNKRDMSKSDLAETLVYNAVDTKYTLRLYHHQIRLLKKIGTHEAYLEALPRQPAVALMQTLGVMVDQKEVKRIQSMLQAELTGIYQTINSLNVVQAYIKDKGEFNPLSDKDAVAIFRDYLKRPEVSITKDGKTRFSTDKNVLGAIDHPLAASILLLRNKNKLKSTYCDGLELGKGELVYPDGKIHCNFNTTFAETGRTSSDDPNMQNFPQRQDAWVRNQVVAEEGHTLVAFDYGQLEACTAAMCSGDKVLVAELWEDYDIHMDFAKNRVSVAFPEGLERVNGDMKKFRSLIKNKFVFPAIFGAQASSIAGYLNMPIPIAEKLLAQLWGKYTGLKRWQDRTVKKYYEDGFVVSPTGRRHNYPLSKNQVVNFPIQSLACDIVCRAMCDLSYLALSTKKFYLHPRLNIHDDLTFSIPDDDQTLEEAITQIYKIMLDPQLRCVNVPLSVSVSIGKSWYGMTEIGKFWSHKDL